MHNFLFHRRLFYRTSESSLQSSLGLVLLKILSNPINGKGPRISAALCLTGNHLLPYKVHEELSQSRAVASSTHFFQG